jgi:hypothetical protein
MSEVGLRLAGESPVATRNVLVLSYFNTPNFGDRLGYHIVNGLLPANAVVTHAPLNPWAPGDDQYDLVILGIGNSLNAPAIANPELHRLIERTPHTIGIFGTQYPYQYSRLMDPAMFGRLLDKLTAWWARYQTDIDGFGGGRGNVRHLGDWLISAFPLAKPTRDRNLVVEANVMDRDISLDRMIQQIQAYRTVSTARLHPMLCALTSAEQVAYQEQREGPDRQLESGKFAAQLRDVFGRSFEEDKFFPVDRDAVVRYKMRVEANMVALKEQIAGLLG